MLKDSFGRDFKYLRLSITKKCNFKCSYCLPNGFDRENLKSELTKNEIINLVSAFAELGIEKVRLTGGEPTIRSDFLEIATEVAKISGIKNLSLTTNGFKLKERAKSYFESGIKNINISVDSLDLENFRSITNVNLLEKILSGVEECLKLPFNKVKINTVFLKNYSYKEIESYINFVKDKNIDVRFIELMPTLENKDFYNKEYISSTKLVNFLEENNWKAQTKKETEGPAKNFSNKDYIGKIGVINPYSSTFCNSCNRLRVESYGDLVLCLLNFGKYSLRQYLANPNQKEDLKKYIMEAINKKPEKNLLNSDKSLLSNCNFSQIGG